MMKMKTKNTMTEEELFENWYARYGCRYYSPYHGSADGHKDYLNLAFLSGLHAAQEIQKEDVTTQD
jgi:hypothetical protein